MSHAPPSVARPLPGWLVFLGSLVIAFHLFALGIYVLAAPSGPWPAGMMGASMAQGPQFAVAANNAVITPYYLRWVKLVHNYHYLSNRPGMPGIRIEIKLKDAAGEVIKTVQLPDPKSANFWVQQRQLNMIRGMSEDQPVEATGDTIAGVGKKTPTVDIWDGAPGGGEFSLKITPTLQHLVPKDRPVMRPSTYALILAKSMARHLCRETGADPPAEVLRISREPVPPMMLSMDEAAPPGTYNNLTSNFGEMSK